MKIFALLLLLQTSCSAIVLQFENCGPCIITNLLAVAKTVGRGGGFSGTITGTPTYLGSATNGQWELRPGVIATYLSTGGFGVVGSSVTMRSYVDFGSGFRMIREATYDYPGTATYIYCVTSSACTGTNGACVSGSASKTVKNTQTQTGIAVFYEDDVLKHSKLLQPGESETYLYEWCRTQQEGLPLIRHGMSFEESGVITDGSGNYSVVNTGGTQQFEDDINSTNVLAAPASGNYDGTSLTNSKLAGTLTNNTAINLTNGLPIVWNNPETTAARDATLKAGFNKLAQQNQSLINASIMNNSAINNLTNYIGSGGSVTGLFSTNVSDARTHELLENLLGNGTNTLGVGDMFGLVTNAYNTAKPTAQTDFDAKMTELKDLTVDNSVPTGSDSFWEISMFPGRSEKMNFRPSNHVSGVFTMGRAMLTWIIIIGFTIFVLKDIFELIKLIASTSQMSAPDAEATIFGVGGNWGLLLIPVVVGIFLAVWAALLLAAGTALGTVLGGIDFVQVLAAGPFGGAAVGAVGEGVSEANKLIPFGFLIGSAAAYASWLASKNIMAGASVFILKMVVK